MRHAWLRMVLLISLLSVWMWQESKASVATDRMLVAQERTKSMKDKKKTSDILEELLSLNRLHENFYRNIDEYDENTASPDTLKWGLKKTSEESLKIIRRLLADRNSLAKKPGKELLYQLQVRRATGVMLYPRPDDSATEYEVLISVLSDMSITIVQRMEWDKGLRAEVDRLVSDEIKAATGAGLYAQALVLCENRGRALSDQEWVDMMKGHRALFDGQEEQAVLDLIFLKKERSKDFLELRDKVLDMNPEEGLDEAWVKAQTMFEETLDTLMKRVKKREYASRIQAFRDEMFKERGRVNLKDYDAKDGSVTVEVVATAPKGGFLERDTQKGRKFKETDKPSKTTRKWTLNPNVNGVVRHSFRDKVPCIGHHTYKLTPVGRSRGIAFDHQTHSRLETQNEHGKNFLNVFARDPLDGKPLPGVVITRYNQADNSVISKMITNTKGRTSMPYLDRETYVVIEDNRLARGYEHFYIFPKRPVRVRTATYKIAQIYTDRPVYRHGQTVKVGVLLYKDMPKSMAVAPNTPGKLVVTASVNMREVKLETLPFTTNANGVAELSFTLPKDEDYQMFGLKVEGRYKGSESLDVKAYKRQHLAVFVDSVTSGYVIGKPLVIHGRVTDYNGLPTAAQLNIVYDMTGKRATMPHSVGNDGKFVVTTPPLSHKQHHYINEVRVSAIDALGRIATDAHSYQKDTTDLPLNAEALSSIKGIDKDDFILSTETQPYVNLRLGDLNRYKVFAYFRDTNGKVFELGELPINGVKKFSLPSLPSGQYILGLRAKDGYGNPVVDEAKDYIIYSRTDKLPPIPTALWVLPILKKGDKTLRFGSSYDSYISLLFTSGEDILMHDIVHVNKKIVDYKIPRDLLSKGELDVKFISYNNGIPDYQKINVLSKDVASTDSLNIVGIKEGEKFFPKAKVHRKLVIKDSKGKPLAHSPVFVTVFDKAVLQATTNQSFWSYVLTRQDETVFGYNDFRTSYDPGAVLLRSDGLSEEAQCMQVTPTPFSENSAMKAGFPPAASGIQVRSDFSETAYFTVLLETNANGEIVYDYELPDTQTKYVEKIFTFDKSLKLQSIKDFSFDVYSPVSVEVNLPRYLTRGDHLIGEALLRNTTETATFVSYQIMAGEKALAEGTQTIPAKASSTVRFEVRPEMLTGDTVSITAQIIGDGYSDAVKREIPLRTDMTEYNIAVPFSLYKKGETTLDLPKLDRLTSVPDLFAYFNPTNLLLTRLAQEYSMAMETGVQKLSHYGALHSLVVFANIQDLFRRQPQVRASIVEALPALQEAAQKSGPVDLRADRGHFMAQRLTDPHTLATFYRFITDDRRLEDYLKALEKKIKGNLNADGGWGFAREHTSVWLTLYTLDMLGDVPRERLKATFAGEIAKAFAYLDGEFVRKESYVSMIDYATTRHTHGLELKSLDPKLASALRKEAQSARNIYRDFWPSRLFKYGKFTSFYSDAKHNAEVQKFVDDMSLHTRSDNEQVGFELYKQARDKGTPKESVIALFLKAKQGFIWDNTMAIQAVRLLLTHITPTRVEKGATLIVGGREMRLTDSERAMGFVSRHMDGLTEKFAIALGKGITTDFFFGGIVYGVTEPMIKVTPTGDHLKVFKEVFARRVTESNTTSLVPVSTTQPARKGEKLIIRYHVETDRDLSLVTIKDDRSAGGEPGNILNGYKVSDRVWWAFRRGEATDRLFIDFIPRGRHTFELEVTVTTEGTFVYGPAEIVSYYAPEFAGNSAGGQFSISPISTKNFK